MHVSGPVHRAEPKGTTLMEKCFELFNQTPFQDRIEADFDEALKVPVTVEKSSLWK
jgi:hypothetical protein